MKALISCLTIAALLGSVPAQAQVKPEDALAYRKSAFGLIVWNFAPLSAMVRGKAEWNDAEFVRRAERVAQLAPQLEEGFPAGSRVGNSEAKDEIWSNWADFQSKLRDFETEANALVQVARAGDAEATKAQFGKVGGTCKACHDNYKQD